MCPIDNHALRRSADLIPGWLGNRLSRLGFGGKLFLGQALPGSRLIQHGPGNSGTGSPRRERPRLSHQQHSRPINPAGQAVLQPKTRKGVWSVRPRGHEAIATASWPKLWSRAARCSRVGAKQEGAKAVPSSP